MAIRSCMLSSALSTRTLPVRSFRTSQDHNSAGRCRCAGAMSEAPPPSREHELLGLDDAHEAATFGEDALPLPMFEQPARRKGTDVSERRELLVFDLQLDVRTRRRSNPRAETRQRACQPVLSGSTYELRVTVCKFRDIGKRHVQRIPGDLWIRAAEPLNCVTRPHLYLGGSERFRGSDVRASRQ